MKDETNIEKDLRESLKEEPEPMQLDKEWLKLESELEVKEFFTFRWNRFNVYYLSSFMASLGMATSALYLALTLDRTTSTQPQLVGVLTDTVYIERILHDTVVLYQYKGENQRSLVPTEIEDQSVHTPFTSQETSHALIGEEKAATKMEEAAVPESKRIVYQYKRDTIVKFDSVKVSKRLWKKMQKNR